MMKHSKWVWMWLVVGILVAGSAWLVVTRQGGVAILAYHQVNDSGEQYSVSADEFRRQMQYLKDHGYQTISLQDLVDSFAGKQLPLHPIVITFDDGYEDNATIAFPIMQEYHFQGTIFVIPTQIDQPGYLSWEQIRMLKSNGMEIGSHTMNHVALSQIPLEEARQELLLSKQAIEQQLRAPVYFLAYPFGSFHPSLFPVLAQTGYRAACSGISGLNTPSKPLYALRRVNIPKPHMGLLEFRLRLAKAKFSTLWTK